MTTCKELLEIIKNREKEKLTVELKTRGTLITRQDDIAEGLASLANRFGGKMIIGFRNNGAPEGKYIFDVDADKGIIDSICTQKCSPPVEYDTEFIECDDFEVLVIYVNKRKGMPHAFIEKSNGEIIKRSYYVRTSHGKRLVTDTQLDWMFKNYSDMLYEDHFTIKIPYLRESLKTPMYKTLPLGPLSRDWFTQIYIQDLKDEIPEIKDVDKINQLRDIYLTLLPLSILERFRQHYRFRWTPQLENGTVATDVIYFQDIENELKYPLESLNEYVENRFSHGVFQISVPHGAKIKLGYLSDYISYLRIYIEDFLEFQYDVGHLFWSVGLPGDDPASYVMYEERAIRPNQEMFAHYKFNGHITTKLDVFNIEYLNYEIYKSWIEAITNIVKDHHSWDEYIKNIPHGLHYRIDENIKKIVRALIGEG